MWATRHWCKLSVLTNVKNGKIEARQYKTLKPTGGLSESKRPTPESAGF